MSIPAGPSGPYEPSRQSTAPLILGVAAVALVIGGGAVAFALSLSDDEPAPAATVERTIVTERDSPPSQTIVTPAPAAPAPSTAPLAPVEDESTVAQGTRYIVQLGSFTSRANADAHAARLRSNGISANVLLSDDYIGLRSGYWVVYDGFYDSESQADRSARDARSSGASDALTRSVQPVS